MTLQQLAHVLVDSSATVRFESSASGKGKPGCANQASWCNCQLSPERIQPWSLNSTSRLNMVQQ